MDEFKNLVDDWNSIKGGAPTCLEDAGPLMEKLKNIQKRAVFSNLFMSIGFAFAFVVMGWVYSSLDDRSSYFYGSIISFFVLMIVTMAFSWYQMLFWRMPDMDQDMLGFAERMIKKLNYMIWLTKVYVPAYLAILALGFHFYLWDILAEAGLPFRIIAYTLTFGWILGMGTFFWKRKKKKNEREIIPIIERLEEIKKSLLVR